MHSSCWDLLLSPLPGLCVPLFGLRICPTHLNLFLSTSTGEVPSNLRVCKQRLRPGSGHLCIKMFNNGPTRLLRVMSMDIVKDGKRPMLQDSADANARTPKSIEPTKTLNKSLEVYINLTGGIGASLVLWNNQEYEELVYAYLKTIEICYDQLDTEQRFDLKIDSIQACNQLLNSQRKNLLYIQMPLSFVEQADDDASQSLQTFTVNKKMQPALSLSIVKQVKQANIDYVLINLLNLTVANVNLQIEEKLLWKLIQFFDYRDNCRASYVIASGSNELLKIPTAVNNYYRDHVVHIVKNTQQVKYCFNEFLIDTAKLNLSVYKTSKLSADLLRIKSSLGRLQFRFTRNDWNSIELACRIRLLMVFLIVIEIWVQIGVREETNSYRQSLQNLY
jgi:hypothetical protein